MNYNPYDQRYADDQDRLRVFAANKRLRDAAAENEALRKELADLKEQPRADHAFAKDAYRQMSETSVAIVKVTEQRDALRAIVERHIREHDAQHGSGGCRCTVCRESALLLAEIDAKCACGEPADGKHEGAYYCARCLAEQQAERDGAV